MNIILAGMPASGKTSVSRALSKLTGREVYDTDEKIVEKYGAISEIFENYGETAFRNLETEEVKNASALDNLIISTGGGCVLREVNVAFLKTNGKIVYLRTSLQTLLSRVNGDSTRPLLKGGAEEKMKKLFAERTPVYESISDEIIDTDGKTVEEIASGIAELIK